MAKATNTQPPVSPEVTQPPVNTEVPQSPVKENKPEVVKKFGKFKATPIFKFRVNEDTGQSERYIADVKKDSETPIQITNIEQHHADTLNSQVEASGLYYEEIK